MLSICIPTYTYDVKPFVRALHASGQRLRVPWEIIVLDDASCEEWVRCNAPLGSLPQVNFETLRQNIGRAAIRNELARRARYEYVLFLDGDGQLEADDFLQKYVAFCAPQRVLCGGRTYAPEPPPEQILRLHWYYGSQREVRPAQDRQKEPYHGFMTNNFVAPKSVLTAIPFDESITTYGHEDTLFGLALKEQGIEVLHLSNPVRHLGLEPAPQWLAKQEVAVANLARISTQVPELDTRLLQLWRRLKALGRLDLPLGFVLEPLTSHLVQHLTQSREPKLWMLDLLKLYWLSKQTKGPAKL